MGEPITKTEPTASGTTQAEKETATSDLLNKISGSIANLENVVAGLSQKINEPPPPKEDPPTTGSTYGGGGGERPPAPPANLFTTALTEGERENFERVLVAEGSAAANDWLVDLKLRKIMGAQGLAKKILRDEFNKLSEKYPALKDAAPIYDQFSDQAVFNNPALVINAPGEVKSLAELAVGRHVMSKSTQQPPPPVSLPSSTGGGSPGGASTSESKPKTESDLLDEQLARQYGVSMDDVNKYASLAKGWGVVQS